MEQELASKSKLWIVRTAAGVLASAGQPRRCARSLSGRTPAVQVVECGGARVLQFEPSNGRQDGLMAQVPACSIRPLECIFRGSI